MRKLARAQTAELCWPCGEASGERRRRKEGEERAKGEGGLRLQLPISGDTVKDREFVFNTH